ncbi:hypothetical protein ACH5RR_012682 [Cinchona calisaya]|uniref:SWIM-type domain-containing protein n=1 Tax=Cinchona calisaya TaxID=153742 RepID=A0ABD3AAU0_9GENT
MLLNNICESFNSKILDARDEFILSMMESLRKYIMNRMQENMNIANVRWITHIFCPKIMKRMKKNIEHAATMIPHKANETLYEVACPYGDVFAVNVSERTCSCRKWDFTGIPCSHAISAIGFQFKINWILLMTVTSEKGHNIRSCNLRKEKEGTGDVGDSPTQDGEGTIHGVDDNQVWEGTQEAPTQGEAQGTQDAHTVVTQEPSIAVVSKSAKRSKEALTQWDAPGTQEACAATIRNFLKTKKLGFLKERKKRVIVHCLRVKALKMENTQETAVGIAFGYRVADAFKRLYDALENLTCSDPAKEPDLFQVFSIEKSITTQSSQPSKGKRNSRVKRAQGIWNLPRVLWMAFV